MANDNKVSLEIEVDAKDAQKAIEQFGASAVKSVKKTESAFDSMKTSFGGFAAGLAAAGAAVALFSKAIAEATESERAVKSLGLAIAGSGEYSKEALGALTDYANSLSELTGIDDDVIVSNLALAKSFGITNDQAKNLVTAATNLSAVTGQDLETSVRQLGGTFDGTIGKLGNLGSEFRNLTQEQIENGAVIDLVNKKYGEAGASLGDSFEGSLNKLTNQFNDAFKLIGQNILGDPAIRNGIDQIGKAIVSLSPIITATVGALVNGFKIIAAGVTAFAGFFTSVFADLADSVGADEIAKGLRDISIASLEATVGFADFSKAADKVDKSATSLDRTLESVNKNASFGNKISKSAKKASEDLKKLRLDSEKFLDDVLLKSGSEIEQAAKKAGEALAKIDEIQKKGLVRDEKKLADARLGVITEFNEKAEKETENRLKRELENEKNLLENEKKNFQITIENSALGVLQGLTTALQGGDEKQRFQGIGNLLSGALQAFLGPLGQVLGSFITQLSQNNKEQTREFIASFVDSAPDFAIAIADNIPEIFSGLLETFGRPSFWERAGRALLKGFAVTLGGLLGGIALKFGEAIGGSALETFNKFGETIAATFNEAFGRLANIFQGIIQAFKDTLAPITNAIEQLKKAVDDLGGKGAGEKAKDVFSAENAQRAGTAILTGGYSEVPAIAQAAGFGLADMSIPGVGGSSQVSSGGGGQDSAVLMAILQAVQQPMVVNSQVKVNQSAFADIILQLNRQNSRLTA